MTPKQFNKLPQYAKDQLLFWQHQCEALKRKHAIGEDLFISSVEIEHYYGNHYPKYIANDSRICFYFDDEKWNYISVQRQGEKVIIRGSKRLMIEPESNNEINVKTEPNHSSI